MIIQVTQLEIKNRKTSASEVKKDVLATVYHSNPLIYFEYQIDRNFRFTVFQEIWNKICKKCELNRTLPRNNSCLSDTSFIEKTVNAQAFFSGTGDLDPLKSCGKSDLHNFWCIW